jgi:ornithine cyclodeaminase
MAGARLFVDRRESALNEAGDLLIPMREGAVTADHIVAELGDVIVGKNPGRRSPDELTLFKSLGLAVEDVASAEFVVEKARASRVGKTVQM